MKPLQDDAYVLRTQPLGESDWIVSLLAKEHGLVRGVAKGARRSRKRFGGLLQTLNEVNARWVEKPGRDLHRLEGVEPRADWTEIQSDPIVHAMCAVLSEVTEAFSHEAQAERDIYRLIGAILQALRDGHSPYLLLRYFEFWMLRLHGLQDPIDVCGRCHEDLGQSPRLVDHGGLMCRKCHEVDGRPGRPFGRELRRFLLELQRSAPNDLTLDVAQARPGGPVESLLRGRLEAFAERRFRTYRYFAQFPVGEGQPR